MRPSESCSIVLGIRSVCRRTEGQCPPAELRGVKEADGVSCQNSAWCRARAQHPGASLSPSRHPDFPLNGCSILPKPLTPLRPWFPTSPTPIPSRLCSSVPFQGGILGDFSKLAYPHPDVPGVGGMTET